MPEHGDHIYAWQERTAEGWGIIATLVPALGTTAAMVARDRDIAERVFGPIARRYGRATGNPVRFARFALAEVEETL